MKISTRTRYGMRAILELALAGTDKPLQIKVIAARQKISNKYLEQLVAIMKAAGLVRSLRGPHGGYLLAKPLAEITLAEVFRVLEGPTLTVDCVDHQQACPSCADCITRQLWLEMNQAIMDVLSSRTLQDLVEMAEKSGTSVNYQI